MLAQTTSIAIPAATLKNIDLQTGILLTGKKDIPQGYEIVRLLDSVPMFVGVDGKNYHLTKDDVVMLPGVHAKNLRTKNLAVEVKIE